MHIDLISRSAARLLVVETVCFAVQVLRKPLAASIQHTCLIRQRDITMLAHSRSIALQHRRMPTRACWLWGDKQQQQASPPVAPKPNAPASAGSQMRPLAVQAAADQQPAQVELIVQPELQPVVAAAPVKPITRTWFGECMMQPGVSRVYSTLICLRIQ